ncbi:hypothetical protein AAMO2058_000529700 [Amorphochlora amoebiformis]
MGASSEGRENERKRLPESRRKPPATRTRRKLAKGSVNLLHNDEFLDFSGQLITVTIQCQPKMITPRTGRRIRCIITRKHVELIGIPFFSHFRYIQQDYFMFLSLILKYGL